MHHCHLLSSTIATLLVANSVSAAPQAGASIDGDALFREKVAPLLARKCFACHGDDPGKLKGDLDMRSRALLLAGGESGLPSLVPGKPEESLLYVAASWADPDLEMPPKENDRLDAAELQLLREWIEVGAPWPESKGSPEAITRPGEWSTPDLDRQVRVGTSGGQNPGWDARTYALADLWAFRPIPNTPLPDGPHPIDAFLAEAMEQQGVTAAEKASAPDVARRVAYGLTGLPPTEQDRSTPYETLVDELLASPHYGERMAQHWLDVTRYADTNGFSKDEFRPGATAYRSYVIQSFNTDKPFDRFIREQIAGDELGLAGQEALAFLWSGPWELTNMTSAAVARQQWLDDVVNSVGVTFLGQQLLCAKCHDHKFDPIPTRDYYAMQAVFASTRHYHKGTFKIEQQAPQQIRVLKGGALESPLEAVRPGLLSAIANAAAFPIPEGSRGRRAAMANWIASPDNPLTARVFVNRVWQWHFGRGLVTTPNGFGAAGAKPTHPELLDWLARWFVRNGWSVKALQRLIVTSDTYRRSTQHAGWETLIDRDPSNNLYAVFQPRRLSAEEIRDSMLAASGELNRRVGGDGFKPQINWEVAFQPRLAMGRLQPPYEPDAKRGERSRRSIYTTRIRNLGHPFMEVFNRPGSEISCAARDETTVVTQAFTLFHGKETYGRSLALAQRITGAPGAKDPAEQVDAVFRAVLGRSPTASEAGHATSHLGNMLTHHKTDVPEPEPLPKSVEMSNVNERSGERTTQKFPLKGMAKYERDIQPWDADAETRALAELCLVLFNSSEFLYVY